MQKPNDVQQKKYKENMVNEKLKLFKENLASLKMQYFFSTTLNTKYTFFLSTTLNTKYTFIFMKILTHKRLHYPKRLLLLVRKLRQIKLNKHLIKVLRSS